VKYVTFYGGPMAAGHNQAPGADQVDPEALRAKLMEVFPEHRKLLDEFHAQGKVLMVGTFENPLVDGSMGIWTSREAAEEFMRRDPFVTNNLIRSWRIMEWNEVLVP